MGQWLVVVLSLGSAAAFAVATSLKHRSASEVPDAQNLQPTAVGHFVRATVVHRLWLAGIAADAVAVMLQIVALHYGALAVVQPLLISGLLFALLLRPVHHQPIGQRELGWAVVAQPRPRRVPGPGRDGWSRRPRPSEPTGFQQSSRASSGWCSQPAASQ